MFFKKKTANEIAADKAKKLMQKIDKVCPNCGAKNIYKFTLEDYTNLEYSCTNCGWYSLNYDWNKSSVF